VEHSDLASAMGNDSAIALGELVGFGDKYFRHSVPGSSFELRKSMASNRTAGQRSGFAKAGSRVAAMRIV
jgi:hypothetical protein